MRPAPCGAATVGPYERLRQLGSGGMGDVYLAKSSTASLVAVKVIRRNLSSDPEIRARFMSEVDNLRTAFGTSVARFEGADLNADQPWLAVEYIAGITLRQHVERHGSLPADLGTILGAVLAEGVETIHAAGLIHRDLKPHNVILGKTGPVIIDFGLAMLSERDQQLTHTGQLVGTPAYMAPEQARGDRDVTSKADVYALGATLVLALTGHTLYQAANPFVLVNRIIDPDDHPDLSGVPAGIAGVVGPMLAYDPDARPTATQVKHSLVRIVRAGPSSAEELRHRLVELTYVDPHLTLPPDTQDPTTDPESMVQNGPTELVATPPTPADTEAGSYTPRHLTRDLATVTRLAERIRARYGRQGPL